MSRDTGEQLFRALLVLYPSSFRARFSDEMLAFFRARRTEARHQGRRGMVRLWRHLIFDIALSAPVERARALYAKLSGSDALLDPAVQHDVP